MSLSLKTLLNNSTEFRAILSKAQGLCEIQSQFLAATPSSLAQYAQVTSLEFGTLTIAAGNATTAAKLRQLAPEILANLKNGGMQVSGIRFKVQVAYPVTPTKNKPRHLSNTAKNAIDQLGDNLADSPLKDALKKMSGTKNQ